LSSPPLVNYVDTGSLSPPTLPTPEVGTLILMLIGIGLFGFLMIRKRISLGLQRVS
jgi:hypothetical protein